MLGFDIVRTVALLAGVTAVSALPAAAQNRRPPAREAPAQPPAVRNVTYEVVFDDSTARTRTIGVTMSFEVSAAGPVQLSLPAWTPGAYELTNFARWVSGFDARRGDSTLAWEKADPDTWQIAAPAPGAVTVRYDVLADSLDNAMAWSRDDFVMFNGTALFMYPEGADLEAYPSTVRIRTRDDWLVATGMFPGDSAGSYRHANYHDLVDMPTFIGRFDFDSMQVSGTWVRLATYPEGSLTGAARAETRDALARMFPPMVSVFGEVPFRTYTVMQIADSSYAGASGLEHQNSHLDVVTPLAVGNPFLHGLFAHEIFHAWNVKRLRPAEMVPYRYDRWQPTTLLWVSEGITDYYADLALVRGGLTTPEEFYAATTGKVQEVANTPAVALEDASLSTWVHPTDGTGYIYYPKGSLVGLLLDVLIRDGSDNRSSLDRVLAELYRTRYLQNRGFTAEDWWAAVQRAAPARDFAGFRSRYVDGRDPLPYGEVLPLAGLRLLSDTTMQPRLGLATTQDTAGVRVLQVAPGGSAAGAGVRAGDYLISIGNLRIDDPTFGAEFRRRYAASAGDDLPITVRRDGETIRLRGLVQLQPVITPRIISDPNASEKAVRIREAILRGTVGA